MTETKKYLVLAGPINHDQELYIDGDPIELTDKAAKRLLKENKIGPIKPASKKNDGEDEGRKDGGQDAAEKDITKDDGKQDKKDENLKDKKKGSTHGGKK